MPEVTVNIGGRPFVVACQPGEEEFLHSAADRLNEEAVTVIEQIGQLPESRMLLMAGLLLADKAAGIEQQLENATQGESAAPVEVQPDLTNLTSLVERAEKLAAG